MGTIWKYAHAGDMLRAYKATFTKLRADGRARVRMFWNSEPLDLDGFRREFVGALHRRITAKAPHKATRKMSSDYQARARRDKYRLRDIANRGRVYQFETDEARRRFGHLLSNYDD